jgi:hypothetical protein
MKNTIFVLCVCLFISCSNKVKWTALELSFDKKVKTMIYLDTVINNVPSYGIVNYNSKEADKIFLYYLENNIFKFEDKLYSIQSILEDKNISFAKAIFGKPSEIGQNYMEYYIGRGCITTKKKYCGVIRIDFDAQNQKINNCRIYMIQPRVFQQ